MYNLIEDVNSTIEGVNAISSLAGDCDRSKDQIVDAMSALSAISEENAASSEETGASMQELNATVGNLSENANTLKQVSSVLLDEVSFFEH